MAWTRGLGSWRSRGAIASFAAFSASDTRRAAPSRSSGNHVARATLWTFDQVGPLWIPAPGRLAEDELSAREKEQFLLQVQFQLWL